MKNKLMIVATLIIVWLTACTRYNEEDLYPQQQVQCASDTTAVISFSRHIQPVFRQYCALAGCHNSTGMAGGLNLDSAFAYASLQTSGSGYIDTVHPKGSLLYSQMISLGTPMPPTGNLDSCTTKLILKWITQKAPDN